MQSGVTIARNVSVEVANIKIQHLKVEGSHQSTIVDHMQKAVIYFVIKQMRLYLNWIKNQTLNLSYLGSTPKGRTWILKENLCSFQ